MANEQNLRPSEYKLTQEEQKKGGKASAEARRRKRDLRLALEALLEGNVDIKDLKGKNTTMSGAEAIAMQQMKKALKGDSKAFEVVRDTSGQSVVQKIAVAEVDESVLKEVEDMVMNDDE